jgi:ATP-dependent Clp protease ATP-binding subunit ClpA
MPKINVYLSDDLAEAVKETGVPVSAICQRALEQSVKRVSAIRAAVLTDLTTEPDLPRFTERAKTAVRLAIRRASGEVTTAHLLHGVLTEGGNLAIQVLTAMEITPAGVLARLTLPAESDDPATRFSGDAANALELAVTEAVSLGHNYIGCEHLLLGIASEPDGPGGEVLRGVGADLKSTRASVAAALVGYAHLRAQGSGSAAPGGGLAKLLAPLVERIERLEKRLSGE